MPDHRKILITLGDPGGIGPEVVIKALNALSPENIVLVGNKALFYETAGNMGLPVPEVADIIDIPLSLAGVRAGEPGRESGKYAMLSLIKCCELIKDNTARAVITAPISKKSINMAGYNFSGQTEVFRKFCRKRIIKRVLTGFKTPHVSQEPEMLFVAGDLRVMLLTRHIKLCEVSQNLCKDNILNSLLTLKYSLEDDFNIRNPKIALCALNPHAGENGILGLEEEYFFIPTVEQLKEKHSVNIEGPFPADTLWAKAARAFLNEENQPYDAYVACYHDQGLIPVKMLAMNSAVNVTINLPVIRTSPSHGTAYDITGKNIADYGSMAQSILLADSISSFRAYAKADQP